MATILKKCKEPDCGKEFSINDAEQNFFISKGLSLPNRCKECRAKRKSNKFVKIGDIVQEEK